ncbi:hypothetical protein NPIL_430951 [Nephila pilipes]|uniref:DUF5641 domain-containing protein n=1 Tax=Nephila pilipes TaxID=299642 RepID=A0A8X6QZM4_NEPPI|nr:hypothetical protein NPIL_430951 [Nephila pilipes]
MMMRSSKGLLSPNFSGTWEQFKKLFRAVMDIGCFNLRGFESNVVYKNVEKHSGCTSVLGIMWDLDNDTLRCCLDLKPGLVQRHLKRKFVRPIQINDIVLVGLDNLKRSDWLIGRVIDIYPGKDNQERVVKVKTKAGKLPRPVKKLYPLT